MGSIAAFVKVAEQGSFAAAGRALRISPSAVSKSVLRLEDRLGVRLFQRTTRSLALTEDGKTFLARCSTILADLEQAEREMRERAAKPSGLLRIEMPTALGRLKIVPELSRLTARYPQLRITATFADTLTDPIVAGLDAVVRIGFPRDERMMIRRVGTVRYIVCATPAYIAAHGAPHSLEDLDRFNCIQRLPPGGDCVVSWWFRSAESGKAFQRPVAGTMTFNNNDAVVEAGLAGVGLVQLHTYMAEPHLTSGALVQVLKDYAVDGPPISVLFPSARQLSPKVRAFIDFVSEILPR
ncbi:LysR family transcriptional regulator [Roseomonas sp. KE2513]|uniref:LysR family transcriptional regulator n=1 Tax=Roseomonas sp. KE2513 TaxID=2479202 RepID=UPI0018DF9ACA|nr:LysR family transcriptional regulator [Roseomonas sp. KE2513]